MNRVVKKVCQGIKYIQKDLRLVRFTRGDFVCNLQWFFFLVRELLKNLKNLLQEKCLKIHKCKFCMKCQYWLNCIHVPSKGLKTEVKKHKKISVNKNNTEKSNAGEILGDVPRKQPA